VETRPDVGVSGPSRSGDPGARPAASVRTVLEAIDLAVTPPGAPAPSVRGLSLRVRSGDWLALAGQNGGGKTSLLLALAGLWPISSGTLTLDGEPFGPGHREDARALPAAVLQDPSSQLLQSTVAEELAFTALNLGRSGAEVARDVARWAVALGLEAELTLDPATLSAGRQQMVLLAAAMVSRPRLLLADEPTAHLDAASRTRVRAVIAREIAQGLAVIWATQDADELAAASSVLEVGPVGPRAVMDPVRGGRAPGDARSERTHPKHGASPGTSGEAAPALVLEILPASPGPGPRISVTQPMDLRFSGRGVTALLGPNGAGKSVLMAAAAGLEKVAQVRVRWMALPSRPPILALQYPELQVFEELVADEIVFAAVARGVERRVALGLAANHLRDMGFDPDAALSRRTWTLSTGEKRIIEVIAALIAPASLVLLDEPTAGLDERRRAALSRLVAARAMSEPVLVASQDLEWVAGTGARCYRLDG